MLPPSSSTDPTGVGVTLPQNRGKNPPDGTLVGEGAGTCTPNLVLPADVKPRLPVGFCFSVFNNVQGF